MANRTFEDLGREMFVLYRQGKFQEAYDLVRQEAPNFPEEAQAIHYNLLCLGAASGHPDEALQAFQSAIDKGLWFAVNNLREDTDLVQLQGQPEFERLVAVCRERAEAAQAQAKPQRVVLPAAGPTQAGASHSGAPSLLVALHGNGQNAEIATTSWRPATEQGWTVLLPQSSQLWGPNAFVWNDREWGAREVLGHVSEVTREVPVAASRTVIGGFSAGGGLAALMALGGALGVAGFLSVGPWVNDVELVRQLFRDKKPQGLRGYIVVGEEDKGCLATSREIAALMKEHGMGCELEIHPGMGHEYPADFSTSIERGLSFILGGKA